MRKVICIGIVLVFAVCAMMPLGKSSTPIKAIEPQAYGDISEHPLPIQYSNPWGITIDANYLYFVENIGRIGMMSKSTHSISEYSIPSGGSYPIGITNDATNVYFTESGICNNIGIMNKQTKSVSEYPIPTTGSKPYGITCDSTDVYFTEWSGNKIGEFELTDKFGAPPVIIENNISMELTDIGKWHKGDGNYVFDYKGESIIINATIQSTIGIKGTELFYRGVGNSTVKNVSLNLVEGNIYAGIWTSIIPKQNEIGEMGYNITTTSISNDSISTNTRYIEIKDQTQVEEYDYTPLLMLSVVFFLFMRKKQIPL